MLFRTKKERLNEKQSRTKCIKNHHHFGYGTGISAAVARKFGAEGFSVAIVARDPEKLSRAVSTLEAEGIKAAAFPADLTNPNIINDLVSDVRKQFGPITVIHWNVFSLSLAGDLTTAPIVEMQTVLNLLVTNLMVAVQAVLPDMKLQNDAAVLVTGGRTTSGLDDPAGDALSATFGIMGNIVAKTAQYKFVTLLGEKLLGDGIYVGQIIVTESVKGTAGENGRATLEPSTLADGFWILYKDRSVRSLIMPGSSLALDMMAYKQGQPIILNACNLANPPAS